MTEVSPLKELPPPAGFERALVVTACDFRHYDLVDGLLQSLADIPDRDFDIGFIQVGSVPAPSHFAQLVDNFAIALSEQDELGSDEGFRVAQLGIKARLPTYFSAYDVYVWLDGDTWVQNADGIRNVIRAARLADLCIHPQIDPNYWNCSYPDGYTVSVYDQLYGSEIRERFDSFSMCNSGVFGATAKSPLWGMWEAELIAVHERIKDQKVRFFSDQIPLHYLIFSGCLSIYPLRAVDNWLALHCLPRIDFGIGRLTAPTFPFEEINIVHLIGNTKAQIYDIGNHVTSLRYPDLKMYLAQAGN